MEEYQIKNPLREEDKTDVKQMLKQLELESMERMQKINNIEYDTLKDYFKEIDKIIKDVDDKFYSAFGRKMTLKEKQQALG
jgi:CRISPR/Cas system-associated endonuclease Cas1